MKKHILLLLLLLSLTLGGCLPQVKATPTIPSTATPTIASIPTAFAIPTATRSLIVPTSAPVLIDTGCTAVTKQPTQDPAAEPLYPPVTEADHIKGPANARVTLIEYSDFQ